MTLYAFCHLHGALHERHEGAAYTIYVSLTKLISLHIAPYFECKISNGKSSGSACRLQSWPQELQMTRSTELRKECGNRTSNSGARKCMQDVGWVERAATLKQISLPDRSDQTEGQTENRQRDRQIRSDRETDWETHRQHKRSTFVWSVQSPIYIYIYMEREFSLFNVNYFIQPCPRNQRHAIISAPLVSCGRLSEIVAPSSHIQVRLTRTPHRSECWDKNCAICSWMGGTPSETTSSKGAPIGVTIGANSALYPFGLVNENQLEVMHKGVLLLSYCYRHCAADERWNLWKRFWWM